MFDGVKGSYYPDAIIKGGTTLVPMRDLFEQFGASVKWDQKTSTVTAIKAKKTIKLTIGKLTAYINSTPISLSVPPQIINNSTMVPLRFVSEAFGADVAFDPTTRTISIYSNKLAAKDFKLSAAKTEDSHIQVSGKFKAGISRIEVTISKIDSDESTYKSIKLGATHELSEVIILPFGFGDYSLSLNEVDSLDNWTFYDSILVRNLDKRTPAELNKEALITELAALGFVFTDTDTSDSQLVFKTLTKQNMLLRLCKKDNEVCSQLSIIPSSSFLENTLDLENGFGLYTVHLFEQSEGELGHYNFVMGFEINNTDKRPIDVIHYEKVEKATLEVESKVAGFKKKFIRSSIATSNVVDQNSSYLNSFDSITSSVASHVDQNGIVSIIWTGDSKKVKDELNTKMYIEVLDANLENIDKLEINKELPLFGGFTRDEAGNYYILWGKKILKEEDKNVQNIMITKYSSKGVVLGQTAFEAGVINTKEPFAFGNSKISISSNNLIVAHFARLMFKSPDGNNHQASQAVYVDSTNMSKRDLEPPYVSHSFDQYLAFEQDNVLFVDRGDFYPRAFQLTKLDPTTNTNLVVSPFHFKKYETVYQYTFSELAGLGVDSNGYVLIGSSENTFDQKMATSQHNESRNLFLQLIDRNFSSSSSDESAVISNGDTQTLGEYTNKGVVWLTHYTDLQSDNVAHPKFVQLADNRYAIFWENFGDLKLKDGAISKGYKSTYYMIVSADGTVLTPETELKNVRLNIGDDIKFQNGYAYWVINNEIGMSVYKLKIE